MANHLNNDRQVAVELKIEFKKGLNYKQQQQEKYMKFKINKIIQYQAIRRRKPDRKRKEELIKKRKEVKRRR